MQLSKPHSIAVKTAVKVAIYVASRCIAFVGFIFQVLATSDKSHSESDELASAIRGGVFNFRTNRFDDGTDPAGWYTLD